MKRIKVKIKPTYEYYKQLRKTWDKPPYTRIEKSKRLYNRNKKHKTKYTKDEE